MKPGSADLFRLIVERASDAIFVADANNRYVFVNDRACTLLGYEREELLGMTIFEVVPPADLTRAPLRSEVARREGALATERRLQRKDGGLVDVELTVWRLEDGHLAAIARDIGPRLAAERALRQSEERYRSLFEHAQVGMFRTRLDGSGFLQVNRKVCEILEGPRERVLQLRAAEVWSDLGAREAMTRSLEERGIAELETQITSLRGNAKTVAATFIRAPEPGCLEGSVVDVTVRHLAEERLRDSLREKEVLLREIHHRVKNNLQIISSLLHLHASHLEDERLRAALRDSQTRVASMALLHQHLYESNDLAVIPFEHYLWELARTLYEAWGVTTDDVGLEVSGGDVALALAVAVPVGLILNELITNALKHAWPSGGARLLSVAIAREEDTYRLRVSDDGGGLPPDFEQRAKASLGSKLVERLVVQLRGTLTRSRQTPGTTVEITFPASPEA